MSPSNMTYYSGTVVRIVLGLLCARDFMKTKMVACFRTPLGPKSTVPVGFV